MKVFLRRSTTLYEPAYYNFLFCPKYSLIKSLIVVFFHVPLPKINEKNILIVKGPKGCVYIRTEDNKNENNVFWRMITEIEKNDSFKCRLYLQPISDAAEDCRALFCGFTDRLPLD